MRSISAAFAGWLRKPGWGAKIKISISILEPIQCFVYIHNFVFLLHCARCMVLSICVIRIMVKRSLLVSWMVEFLPVHWGCNLLVSCMLEFLLHWVCRILVSWMVEKKFHRQSFHSQQFLHRMVQKFHRQSFHSQQFLHRMVQKFHRQSFHSQQFLQRMVWRFLKNQMLEFFGLLRMFFLRDVCVWKLFVFLVLLTFWLGSVPFRMGGSERNVSSLLTCPQPRFEESSSSVWSTSVNSPGFGIKHLYPRVCLVLLMFHFSIVCKGDFLKYHVFFNPWSQNVSTIWFWHRLDQVKRSDKESDGPDAVEPSPSAPNAPEPSQPRNLSAVHHARWNFVPWDFSRCQMFFDDFFLVRFCMVLQSVYLLLFYLLFYWWPRFGSFDRRLGRLWRKPMMHGWPLQNVQPLKLARVASSCKVWLGGHQMFPTWGLGLIIYVQAIWVLKHVTNTCWNIGLTRIDTLPAREGQET